MRGWIAASLIVVTTFAIIAALYVVRNENFGLSNVCLKVYEECK